MREVWPCLIKGDQNTVGNLWIPDTFYWLPTLDDVEKLLQDTFMEKYRWVTQIFDCDTLSKVMSAFVAQERYRLMEEKNLSSKEIFEWAFFECGGTRFHGQEMRHAINGCITSDSGIVLIDARIDKMWRPRIWNRVLTASEWLVIFNAERSWFGV